MKYTDTGIDMEQIKSIRNKYLFNFLNVFPQPKNIVPQPNRTNIIVVKI